METIKKHIAILAVLFAVLFTVALPGQANAATYPATTLSLPTYDNSGALVSNPYFIMYDKKTGYLINAATGVPGVATTWADAAFDSGHWTGGAVSTITGIPNLIIPALSSGREYGLLLFDGASPAKTDTLISKGLYSPRFEMPYSDTTPTQNGEVMSRTPRD